MRLDDLRARRREEALERGHNPRDVDLLLSHVTQRSVSWIIAHGDELLDAETLDALLRRRYEGEPIQYIRGATEFYSREFVVDDRVLIPRPETELVVEAALERAPNGGLVVDVGTGSGCIAISIERERPDLRVVALDRSLDALAVATVNRRRLNARVRFAAADLLSCLRERVDVIVSNPPYVPLDEYETLAVEVRIHEPRMALTPGPRGTELIDRMLEQALTLLAPAGCMIIEVGYGQEEAIRKLAAMRGFHVEAFIPDLAAIPRVVVLSAHG
ncbi:MAG TPA: peptide chain release factor N(5)-glutamine methyltransferase [Thermoanaerobaculia bacterium]